MSLPTERDIPVESIITVVRRQIVKDALRKYRIYLDAEYIGSIGFRQRQQFPLSNGKHYLQLTIGTTGGSRSDTLHFEVEDGNKYVVTAKGLSWSETADVLRFINGRPSRHQANWIRLILQKSD